MLPSPLQAQPAREGVPAFPPVPRSTAGSTAETAGCEEPASRRGRWEGWDGRPVWARRMGGSDGSAKLHAACVTHMSDKDKAGGQPV